MTSAFSEPPAPKPLPSRLQAGWFWFRIRALTAQRIAMDWFNASARQWPVVPASASQLADAPVIAEYKSPLWTDGRTDEFALVAGKVHNLRLARKAFDGLEVPAHAVLSFWQQLGRVTQAKGYVLGREIREGCVVPTIAGGICQLSNALATVAHRAGWTLIERHGHTAGIESALKPPDQIDATVLWKHIDLRIQSPVAFRLEVLMDAEELVVRLRAHASEPTAAPHQTTSARSHATAPRIVPIAPSSSSSRPERAVSATAARSCVTCNETSCFRHRPELAELARITTHHTTLLEGLTPELAEFLSRESIHASTAQPVHRLLLPHAITRGQTLQVARQLAPAHWITKKADWSDKALALRRALWLRWYSRTPGQRQASIVQTQEWQAKHSAQALQSTDLDVLVDQAYLPSLWHDGVLAGRRFSVWMPALPSVQILHQLDAAARQWPDEASLSDFRPSKQWVDNEQQALLTANRIITPHHAVAQWARAHLKAQVLELDWSALAQPHPPSGQPAPHDPQTRRLVLTASALPRKGWRELCAALGMVSAAAQAQSIELQLVVLGSLPSKEHLPPSMTLMSQSYASNWLTQADAAVLPAHIEHSPRAALLALAAGLPLVATPACGIPPQAGLQLVPAGDSTALAAALLDILQLKNGLS